MEEISYAETSIAEYNCPLGSFEFLGQEFELQTSVFPVLVDGNNQIQNGLRAMGISFPNWDGYFIFDSNYSTYVAREFQEGEIINSTGTWSDSNGLIYFEQYEFGSFYPPGATILAAGNNPPYLGFHLTINAENYFGYVKWDWSQVVSGIHLQEVVIESSPNTALVVGSGSLTNQPSGLGLSYSQSPEGIYLNWQISPDALACQVRGGPIGGNDPHNFIVTTAPYNELFINGSSLIIGQEYQWKVRCATGINPYSGISDWSDYDYFIYDP
ncbi:MAG: hypothetical protein AAF487_11485 [Bacteroidota bacterium]